MKSSYNLLKDAFSIKNSTLCAYDSLQGFSTDFSENGNVDGWDIYSNICLYGVWNRVLFGTSLENNCYISRSHNFIPISAEDYSLVKITMKLTIPEELEKYKPSQGKIMWQTYTDFIWNENKTIIFDLDTSAQWYTYTINAAEAQYWVGSISNIRVYPFINGKPDIRFTIKKITIESVDKFKCLNTQCSYHNSFSHPCPGSGSASSITSGISKERYTTEWGISDNLILNIDGYGEEHIHLGDFTNLTGSDMAKILIDKISRVSIGQYTYAEAIYDENTKQLTIYSGNRIDGGSIVVDGSAAIALGFKDENGKDVSAYTSGESPAIGFDFAPSRRLKGFEINELIDLNTEHTAYYHNPNQYNVEAGRRDYIDSMSNTTGARSVYDVYYEYLDGNSTLLIDGSHPVNDSGRITDVYIAGQRYKDIQNNFQDNELNGFESYVVLIRPHKNGELEIINYEILPDGVSGPIYTEKHITYSVEVNWLVNKGDLIGFYNINVFCPFSENRGKAIAVYYTYSGWPTGKFNPGPPPSNGTIGLSYYARSNRLQENILLDIDLGKRRNIEEISIYGKELGTFFEYNVAACLDVNWQCNCHGESHWHRYNHCYYGIHRTVTHQNMYYGLEALSDCIRSPDGGKQGDSYNSWSNGGSTGLVTLGTHIYFYVNGDDEWLNGGCGGEVTDKWEFYHPWVGSTAKEYQYDPISLFLIFPEGKKLSIHKSGIYFKEVDNYKHLSLSYYMGEFGQTGNAEEVRWNYVPDSTFRKVTVDGAIFTPDTETEFGRVSEDYLDIYFSNPWPWAKVEWKNGKATNFEEYQTLANMKLNVLEHEFEPVDCYGFKYHTAWHKSTKISEIEVYSSLNIEPSLLDNVRIQYSIYGAEWRDLIFNEDEVDTEKIDAYVSGSPRYFRLEIQSQDIFKLREIDAVITNEDLKALDCEDTILIENAPKYSMVDLDPLHVKNTYGILLNMLVSVPNRLFKDNDVLSWIRFNSTDSSVNGEIGPGAQIMKNYDFDINLFTGQIANNAFAYYLKNLIDNKNSYILENEGSWKFFKELHHLENVGYSNYPNGKSTVMEFPAISSKYWKIGLYEVVSYTIKNLTVYKKVNSLLSNPVGIDNIYIQAEVDNKSGKIETTINEDNLIQPADLIHDEFDDGVWTDFWDYYLGHNNNNFIEKNNSLYPAINSGENIYIEKSFLPGTISFDMEVDFRFDLPNEMVYTIELFNPDDEVVFRLKLIGLGDENIRLGIEFPVPSLDQEMYFEAYNSPAQVLQEYSIITKNTVDFSDGFIFSGHKEYDTFTNISLTNSDGSIEYYKEEDFLSFMDRVSKFRISYTNLAVEGIYDQLLDFGTNYVKFSALPILSDKEFIVFEFNGSEPIDMIKLFQEVGEMSYPVVFISNNDDNDYVHWARNFEFSNNLETFNYRVYANYCCDQYDPFQDGGEVIFWEGPDHWLVYDFGAGNERDINTIYYEQYDFTDSDKFKYFQIFGSNEYKVNYEKTGSEIFNLEFDFSVANLLGEFYINYSGDYSMHTFNNNLNYRYYIIKWPEAVDSSNNYRPGVRRIKFYKQFSNKVNFSIPTYTHYNIEREVGDGKTYSTIQLAIDDSSDGDVIKIFPGTYSESIIYNKLVHIIGQGRFPQDVNITNYGHNIILNGIVNPDIETNIIFNNFKIQSTDNYHKNFEFDHQGDLININWILNNLFIDLSVYGYGISLESTKTNIYLYYCQFYNTHPGYEILNFDEGYMEIHRCEFDNNIHYNSCTIYPSVLDYVTEPTVNYGIGGNKFVVDNSVEELILSNENYTNYFAIDLGAPHNIDFLRNYCCQLNEEASEEYTKLLEMFGNISIEFSGSDVSNLDNINWKRDDPILLLNFGDYTDSSHSNHTLSVEGNVTLYTSDSAVSPEGHVGFNGGTITIPVSQDFNFLDHDFTLDFWIKRNNLGQEGIMGRFSGYNISSSFVFEFSSNDKLTAIVYVDSGLFQLESNYSITDNIWHHIALIRYQFTVALYIDGELQDCHNLVVGQVLNMSNEDLIMGSVDYVNFSGYLDELRILIGVSYWKENFEPPEEAYTIDVVGDISNARWIKIPFECGDGVDRILRYLEVYPNIMYPYMQTGGYNCEWEYMGNAFTDYSTFSRNLVGSSGLINTFSDYQDFNSIKEDEWSNLSYMETTLSGISKTDFCNLNPDAFWSSTVNNLNNSNSNIVYDNSLKVNLDELESGECYFVTKTFYSDCSCEIEFKHELNYLKRNIGEMKTILYMCKEDDTKNISIERRIIDNNASICRYEDDNLKNCNSFSTDYSEIAEIAEITKFRISRQNTNIILSYYNFYDDSWTDLASYDDIDFEASSHGVYFVFKLDKNETFPADIVNLSYIKIIEDSRLVEGDINWCLDSYEIDNSTSGTCLVCNSGQVSTEFGPLFSPNFLEYGQKIEFLSFKYSTLEFGGGVSILDSNGDEILGAATFPSKCGILSSIGWTFFEDFPLGPNSAWYQININFDWDNYTATIDWVDDVYMVNRNATVSLIKQTNVSKFIFRNTFGSSWGSNSINIKFDHFVIENEKNWMYNYNPQNCISGDSSKMGFENSWGFKASDSKPTIVLDLGDVYRVNKFVLHHDPIEEDNEWMNNDYTISISTTSSGNFSSVVEIVGNTSSTVTYDISDNDESYFVKDGYVSARYVRLEIYSYSKPEAPPIIIQENLDGTLNNIYVDGGFLREFEVWSVNSSTNFYSIEHPIICLDLREQFNISGHDLEGRNDGNPRTIWSNDSEFFQFSSDLISDPKRVVFSASGGVPFVFFYNEEIIDYNLTGGPYVIGTSVFMSKGYYEITWKTYGTRVDCPVVIDIISGGYKVSVPSIEVFDTWANQVSSVIISEDSYYSIQVRSNTRDIDNVWGVSDITFKKTSVTTKWVALRRHTVEDHYYDKGASIPPVEHNSGILKKIKFYTSDSVLPTENHWWWTSSVSTLENENINTKVGKKALKINYPKSTKIDNIEFLEGDFFGQDVNFSIKDSLSFWLYIEDLDKWTVSSGVCMEDLDLWTAKSYVIGGISIGSFYGYKYVVPDSGGMYWDEEYTASPAFYVWDLNDMSLKTGWNYIRLKFDEYASIYPETNKVTGVLNSDANFRKHALSSLGISLAGGGEDFYLIFDGFKIERNYFYDEVIFGDKGLCLTWNEYAQINLSSATISRGSVEMWLKLYTDTSGKDHFGDSFSRTLFTFVNSNDDSLSLSIRGSNWFEIGRGNIKSNYSAGYVDTNVVDLGPYAFDVDSVIHVALVWSCDGTEMPNNDTIRLYVNGDLTISSKDTWEVLDAKGTLFRLGGGNTFLANNDDFDGAAIFSNVKYYNFCKTDFEINQQRPKVLDEKLPNDFIEISKDNINFYNNNSVELPIVYKELEPNEEVIVYSKIDKSEIDSLNKSTGEIVIDWQVPV